MNLFAAPFRLDVSPPKGHPLCGGWIKPVVDYDDRLEAIGVAILGAGSPIVLCAVDWTGILNSAHVEWRQAIADAAHTTSDRVSVHCVHQHNAPFVCLESQRLVSTQPDMPSIVDVSFFRQSIERAAEAVKEAMKSARPLTHVAVGKAKVERVAGNRRMIGGNGKVEYWRGSSCTDETIRAMPEGLIDPWLRTIALYDQDTKVVAMHYYATHPMSYYGDGRVSSDFVGLARKRRQEQDADCTHIYFTGCAGNVAAGKYNDGSKQARVDLTDRIYAGIVASEMDLQPERVERIGWKTADVLPPSRSEFDEKELEQTLGGKGNRPADRARSAMKLAWLRRVRAGGPKIVVGALHVNDVRTLHLPGECFVEYQLRAQEEVPGQFVAMAAYGDGGPWYIPVRSAYPQGGYEVEVAFCDPPVDEKLAEATKAVLGKTDAGG